MSGRHLPLALVFLACAPDGQLDPARPVTLAGGQVPCTANPDCEDHDPCTTDTCDLSGGSPGTCLNSSIPSCCRNDSECPSDGDVCTREICHGTAHTCSSVAIVDCCDSVADPCADGSSCTLDACDVGSGTCTHTGIATCCTIGGDCDDSNPCTTDTCVGTVPGTCSNTPITDCCVTDAFCQDGDLCTHDTCNPATNRCEVGDVTGCCNAAGDCDDGDPCSTNDCDLGTHLCTFTPIGGCGSDAGGDDGGTIDGGDMDGGGTDGGGGADAGGRDSGAGSDARAVDLTGGGCACRAASSGRAPAGGAPLVLLALLGAFACHRRRRRSGLTVLLLTLALPALARANGFDAQHYQPTTSSTGYFTVEKPLVLESRRLDLGVSFDLAHDMLVVRDRLSGEAIGDIVTDRVTTHLLGAYGFGVAELGADLPFVLTQDGSMRELGSTDSISSMAIGDLRLAAKIGLFRRDIEDASLRLAFAASFTLPTGESESFTGNETPVLHPRLLAGLVSSHASGTLSLGYRLREEATLRNTPLEVDDEITAGLALALEAIPRVWILGEAYLVRGVAADGAERETPVETLLGGRFLVAGNWAVQAALGLGVTEGYGAPTVRGVLSVAYSHGVRSSTAPRQRLVDSDGDGVTDGSDKCANEAEDPDGYQDDDGCPDNDNDADYIVDSADRCPMQAGSEENGGCPDQDRDADGIVDRVDRCADSAEDKDGFADEDGCPDEDNDQDGLADAVDKCAVDPEDKDGFEDDDGCPDPDNDKDGFADGQDKCPVQAEIFNGKEDEDGCPDQGDPLVVLTAEKIEIRQQIFFALNRAVIQKKSFPLLAAVARIMTLHPEFRKVRIEGHTDDHGKREHNVKLSQERADSVKKHLVEVGKIEAGRLEAAGFGPDRPIADNKTNDGRAKNRRVDFVIAETTDSLIPLPTSAPATQPASQPATQPSP